MEKTTAEKVVAAAEGLHRELASREVKTRPESVRTALDWFEEIAVLRDWPNLEVGYLFDGPAWGPQAGNLIWVLDGTKTARRIKVRETSLAVVVKQELVINSGFSTEEAEALWPKAVEAAVLLGLMALGDGRREEPRGLLKSSPEEPAE